MRDEDRHLAVASAHTGEALPATAASRHAAARYRICWRGVKRVVKLYRGTDAQSAGRAAEQWHAETFNANAIRQGRSDLVARVCPSSGRDAKGPDIIVTKNGDVVARAQSKYCGKGARTAEELSRPDYRDMQKLCPSDQIDQVRATATRRAAREGQRAVEYADTVVHADDCLRVEGVNSDPLPRHEAVELARHPARISWRAVKAEVWEGAKAGAAVGATLAGLISAVRNYRAYRDEHKSGAQAMIDTIADSTKGAIAGAVVGGASSAIRSGIAAAGFEALAAGSVPLAIAVALTDTVTASCSDAAATLKGEMSPEEFASNLVNHSGRAVARGGGVYVGTELGAACGSAILPGVGTIGGAMLGGLAGYAVGNAAVDPEVTEQVRNCAIVLALLALVAFIVLMFSRRGAVTTGG